jgi:hypothetical protein
MSSFSIRLPSVKIGVTVTTESTEFSGSPRSPQVSKFTQASKSEARGGGVSLKETPASEIAREHFVKNALVLDVLRENRSYNILKAYEGAVRTATGREELIEFFSEGNRDLDGAISHSSFRRISNLLNKRNLITSVRQSRIPAISQRAPGLHETIRIDSCKIESPFYTPESESMAETLRRMRFDYLKDDTLDELKQRILDVISDEQEAVTIFVRKSISLDVSAPPLELERKKISKSINKATCYVELKLIILSVLNKPQKELARILPEATIKNLFDRFHSDGFLEQIDGSRDLFPDEYHYLEQLNHDFPSGHAERGLQLLKQRCAKLFA